MINPRIKGKTFERRIVNIWKSLFGGVVERSSYVNKKLDNAGVDIVGTDPFSLQCKAVERSLNYHDIIEKMPLNANYNVVLHKRNNRGTVAAMNGEDFFELVKILKENKLI